MTRCYAKPPSLRMQNCKITARVGASNPERAAVSGWLVAQRVVGVSGSVGVSSGMSQTAPSGGTRS